MGRKERERGCRDLPQPLRRRGVPRGKRIRMRYCDLPQPLRRRGVPCGGWIKHGYGGLPQPLQRRGVPCGSRINTLHVGLFMLFCLERKHSLTILLLLERGDIEVIELFFLTSLIREKSWRKADKWTRKYSFLIHPIERDKRI